MSHDVKLAKSKSTLSDLKFEFPLNIEPDRKQKGKLGGENTGERTTIKGVKRM